MIVAVNLWLNRPLLELWSRGAGSARVTWSTAWMVVPGHLHVRDLVISDEGIKDSWSIAADSASGVVALRALFDRHLQLHDVHGVGVSVVYRRRAEREPAPPSHARAKHRWRVSLDDLGADVRDLQIGAYSLTGDARATGTLSIGGPIIELDMALAVHEMSADVGAVHAADALTGEVRLLVERVDRRSDRVLEAVSLTAQGGGDVYDLRFLDFYLAEVPWLSLEGVGAVELDLVATRAVVESGSWLRADFPELVVRLGGEEITGAGTVVAEVGVGPEGAPQSRIAADFDRFEITTASAAHPLVVGTGFEIDVTSPDVNFDLPFSSVLVVAELPLSVLPDVSQFNGFLLADIGLSVLGGAGTVHGRVVIASVADRAAGDMVIEGTNVRLLFDTSQITTNLVVHGRLADARLAEGWYDLSGSSVDLRRVGLIDALDASRHDEARDWRATLTAPSAVVHLGQPVVLDTVVDLQCTDSLPFVALFGDRATLPALVQLIAVVPDVSGQARLRLGPHRLELDPCTVSGGGFQLDLRVLRDGGSHSGALLLDAGPLALGVELTSKGPQLQAFGARRWFHKEDHAEPATVEGKQ